jgi:hypothetical protein
MRGRAGFFGQDEQEEQDGVSREAVLSERYPLIGRENSNF